MKRILYYNELNKSALYIYDLATSSPIKIGLTGGHYNPCHSGHLDLFRDAKRFCNFLIVAVNNDEASVRKHGYSFMPLEQRMDIISELRPVDLVIENPNDTMEELIRRIRPHVYLKGGDVTKSNLHPLERDACLDVKGEVFFGVGGNKTASSSDFVDRYKKYIRFTGYKDDYK